MQELADENFDYEVIEAIFYRQALEKLYKSPVIRLASPYGTYNLHTIEKLKILDVQYGRTIKETHRFELSENFLIWSVTCHDNDTEMDSLID